MIQQLKKILAKAGITFLRTSTFHEMVHIRNLHNQDCLYLLKQVYGSSFPLVIADIGANTGQSALKFTRIFPHARIYSLEPVFKTYQQLLENVNGHSNILPFHLAAGSGAGELEIFHQENSQWNSLVPEMNKLAKAENATSETVKIITMNRFVAENGINRIHLLKTDTEGFEMEVFKGADELLKNHLIDYIYVETGFMQQDVQHGKFCEILSFLQIYGYQFSGLYELSLSRNHEVYYANALFTSKIVMNPD